MMLPTTSAGNIYIKPILNKSQELFLKMYEKNCTSQCHDRKRQIVEHIVLPAGFIAPDRTVFSIAVIPDQVYVIRQQFLIGLNLRFSIAAQREKSGTAGRTQQSAVGAIRFP